MTTPQLPLSFRFAARTRFQHFLAGDNAPVVAAVEALAHETEDFVGILLAGPEGSGKTHLASALVQTAAEVRFLPLRSLGDKALLAIETAPEQGLVVIDDIDALAGRRLEEIAMFDLFNRLKAARARLLVTSSELPNRLPIHLPDLLSRLASLAQHRLRPLPEFEIRTVLVDRARDRGLSLSGEVLDFLLRRYPRNLGALIQLIDQLDVASMAAQRRLTVPFVRRVIEGGQS
ncbi:DnaA regulatory inactivator Hda [Ahniella affigens]|uniref:DnaA regulatory inactivator Hda n=1 Tax=Ahniella affigens TaxID=2021234 RepID=UPI001476176F|nr:DnaA regulatory inactivator Hda [Ahniella affigens]